MQAFQGSGEETVRLLNRLRSYGVLKVVKADDARKDLTDLTEEEFVRDDLSLGEREYLYVFSFVGVIIAEGRVLKSSCLAI